MTKRYIIDKADIHDLLAGKELSLPQGRESAFCITISGNMTNGDMIKAIFPNCKLKVLTDKKEVVALELKDVKEWWNAPYEAEGRAE